MPYPAQVNIPRANPNPGILCGSGRANTQGSRKYLNQSSPSRFKPTSRIILWILSDRGRTYSLVETLRSLVYQVLSFKFTAGNISPNEISGQVNKFRDACFEEDYLAMLGSLLHNFKLVCTSCLSSWFLSLVFALGFLPEAPPPILTCEIRYGLLTYCRHCCQRGSI